ncbi:hypothetical protein ACOME3_005759 [Neoechinorhynchus agilis]
MNDDRRRHKIDFVTNCTGTNFAENFILTATSTIATNVLAHRLMNALIAHCFTSLILIVQLTTTFKLTLPIVIGIIILLKMMPSIQTQNYRTSLLMFKRTLIMLTCVSIYAVDFPLFPRRLAKTERSTHQLGLMDFGVGMFSVLNGLSYKQRISLKSSIKHNLPILLIGLVKPIIVHALNYQVHESEYGRHWNYFITLFIIKMTVDGLGPLFAFVIGSCPINMLQITLSKLGFLLPVKSNSVGIIGTFGHLQLCSIGVYIQHFTNDIKSHLLSI